jgi:hypothetical protein
VRCPKENLRRGFQLYVLTRIAKWPFSEGDCGKKGRGRKSIIRQSLMRDQFLASDADCSSLHGRPFGLVDLRCISRANSPLEV